MTKQSEVERLAKVIKGLCDKRLVDMRSHTGFLPQYEIAQAILDEGYLHRDRLELDAEKAASIVFNALYDHGLQTHLNIKKVKLVPKAAKQTAIISNALAAAKDEIITFNSGAGCKANEGGGEVQADAGR